MLCTLFQLGIFNAFSLSVFFRFGYRMLNADVWCVCVCLSLFPQIGNFDYCFVDFRFDFDSRIENDYSIYPEFSTQNIHTDLVASSSAALREFVSHIQSTDDHRVLCWCSAKLLVQSLVHFNAKVFVSQNPFHTILLKATIDIRRTATKVEQTLQTNRKIFNSKIEPKLFL